jgi:hypothetical protein
MDGTIQTHPPTHLEIRKDGSTTYVGTDSCTPIHHQPVMTQIRPPYLRTERLL